MDTPEWKSEDVFAMLPSLMALNMKTKDGEDIYSDIDDDDYGDEGGEDELDEEEELALLEAQLSDKQKAKLKEHGVSIQEYLAGNGPELTDEDGDDEEGEDDLDGDDDDEAEGEGDEDGVDGEKRAKQD